MAEIYDKTSSTWTEGTPDGDADFIAYADTSTGTMKRTTPTNLVSDAVAELSLANQQYALRFDAVKGHHVNHGPFWLPGELYTSFYWDALVSPTLASGTGYMISAGYGGAHNLLLGFTCSGGTFAVTGNIWDGASTVSFNSTGKFALNKWHHIAVQWDLTEITVYVNGVAEAKTAYVDTDRSTPANTDSVFFVGGSDHNMMSMDLAWIRGFEGTLPGVPANLVPFRVNLWPMSAINNSGATIIEPQFLADYTYKAGLIADHSAGLNGVRHPGIRATGARLGGFLGSFPAVIMINDEADLPQWVATTIEAPNVATAVTVPSGPAPKVYDSFSNREYSPFWSDTDGLGSTEGGSAGVAAWSTAAETYGISSGCAYPKTSSTTDYANVEVGSQTQDIHVTCEGTRVTLAGRYTDGSNFVYGQVLLSGGVLSWEVGKKVAGVFTSISSGNTPAAMATTVRLVINGTALELYTDGVNRVTTTDGSLPTGTKAGFNLVTEELAKVSLFEVY